MSSGVPRDYGVVEGVLAVSGSGRCSLWAQRFSSYRVETLGASKPEMVCDGRPLDEGARQTSPDSNWSSPKDCSRWLMSENSIIFARLAMPTPYTAPGLKGVGKSISPELGRLGGSGFRHRDARDVTRRMVMVTIARLQFWTSLYVSVVSV